MKALTLALVSVMSLVPAGARQTAPPRDAAVITPTVGTASVAGVVMTAETQPQPVRRAVVTLTGPELTPSRSAITDDDGRFAIGNLPAGRVTLTVERASFVTSVYGAKRPGRPGTAILLAAGQQIRDLVVRLWRGAAIAGVLRDDTGAPVEGLPVSAIPARTIAGQPIPTLSNNGTTTNELGEFRIFGLEPGSYVISATPPAGGGGPMSAMADAEVDAALDALARRVPRGAPGAPPPPPSTAAKTFAYAPIYFPGTAIVTQATPIVLTAGEERLGLEFSLQRIPTAFVEGVVTRPGGGPAAGATLQMTTVSPGRFASVSPLILSATAGPDGRFRIPQVTPGDYRIVARASAQPGPASPPAGGGLVTPGPAGPSLWASGEISVTGNDVSNVALALEPGLTIAGRIRVDGNSTTPAPDLARLRVWLVTPAVLALKSGSPINSMGSLPLVSALADGSFQIAGVLPDAYYFRVSGPGVDNGAWWVRSAMAGDRDLCDGLVEFNRSLSTTGVIVTLSDRHTELSGTLQTPAGTPASDVFVIAFPAERALWSAGSRRVQAVRPAVDGRYSIKDLPPGNYLLGAVTDVDQDEWFDPGFLDALVGSSAKVSIAEGGKTVQNLRLGGGF